MAHKIVTVNRTSRMGAQQEQHWKAEFRSHGSVNQKRMPYIINWFSK